MGQGNLSYAEPAGQKWVENRELTFCFVFIDREILKKDPFLVFTTFLRILVAPFKERPSGRDGNKGLLV